MRWIFRKILVNVITIFTVVTLSFFLLRLTPGNPVDTWVMERVNTYGMDIHEAYKMAQAIFSIDVTKPLHEQYFDYLLSVLKGDLGVSFISTGTPVTHIIAYTLPWTVFITSISLSTSFAIGVILGMFIAYRRGTKADKSLSFLGSLSGSIPNYMIALLFLVVLGLNLKLFPLSGAYDHTLKPSFTFEFLASVFRHAALPVLSYVSTSFGGWMLGMRSSTISTLGEDYISFAEAKGLPNRRIILSYVGRNAILPLFTSLAIQIGYMFGGSIFIETTFNYPGIGYYMTRSIGLRDYTVAQGCFLIIAISVVLANFLADIMYAKLDPRVRVE